MIQHALRRLVNVAAFALIFNALENQASAAAFQARRPSRNRAPVLGAVTSAGARIHEDRQLLFSTASSSNEFLEGLASSYPDGTPPGLRGEAIRSALRSGKCLAYRWRHGEDPLAALDFGLVRIQGRGTRAFLHSKLTRSFINENLTRETSSSFQSACLLNGKGQVVDLVHVAIVATTQSEGAEDKEATEEAFVLTSPGHSSTELFRRLDPFVFPLDRVTLTDCSPTMATKGGSASAESSHQRARGYIFTLASAERAPLQDLFDRAIVPEIKKWLRSGDEDEQDDAFPIELPTSGGAMGTGEEAATAVLIHSRAAPSRPISPNEPRGGTSGGMASLLIVPYAHLPDCAAVGYTFYLWDDGSEGWAGRVGAAMWHKLMDDADGPIYVGPLEWETLRIEAGHPRYGREYTGGLRGNPKKKNKNPLLEKAMGDASDESEEVTSRTSGPRITPASPLELHLEGTVDMEKGCYLGQEGVASVLKNPRGPPRTLYQVVFDDEFNHYDEDGEDGGDDDKRAEAVGDNLTRPPAPGDALFVLGSNQEISAGILTSVAEPGGTGEAVTIGLALVPRADSILKRMADRGLSIRESAANVAGSPPLSPPVTSRTFPLNGLEIIVGGTFTVGRLQAVPGHRYRQGGNMFLDNPADSYEEDESQRWNPIRIEPDESESVVDESPDPWESDDSPPIDVMDSTETEVPSTEADEAQAAAAAESKRKAEKLELLRKRAEEALAKRRSKKNA